MKSLKPEFASLLTTPEPPELGPGPRPGVRAVKELERDVETALASSDLSDANRKLALGLILLWHDHLDAAHTIAQANESRDGSYLHAIMHRREPDYSNAKYWFRRVGQHACYTDLANQAVKLLAPQDPELLNQLAPNSQWDAFAFVDACETASRKQRADKVLRQIQAFELMTLLNYLAGCCDS
jgi:hypothetical protein